MKAITNCDSNKSNVCSARQRTKIQYPSHLPDYRNLHCEIKGQNPVLGLVPVLISPQSLADAICKYPVTQPVAEIESLVTESRQSPHSIMSMPFTADQMAVLYNNLQINARFPLIRITSASQMESVVQAVRNAVLEWSLKLEEDGIIGKGLSFSPEEKHLAASHHYNIGNYVENMNQSQIQQNTQDSTQNYVNSGFDAQAVATLLREFGDWVENAPLEAEQKAEIVADLQTVESQTKSPKPNNAIITAGLSSVKSVLEQAAIKTLSTEAPHYAAQAAHWVEKLQHLIGSIAS